jgi:hypothetical protein
VIGIWPGTILVNPFSRARSGLVELVADLFCSVAIKRALCFGLCTIEVPPPLKDQASGNNQPAEPAPEPHAGVGFAGNPPATATRGAAIRKCAKAKKVGNDDFRRQRRTHRFTGSQNAEPQPMPSERHEQEMRTFHRGGPDWLGLPKAPVLPLGVSVRFDSGMGVWCLRDEFQVEPVIGWSESKEAILRVLTNYVAEVRQRARRQEHMEAGR